MISANWLLVILDLIGLGMLHFGYITFGLTCIVTTVVLLMYALIVTIFDL